MVATDASSGAARAHERPALRRCRVDFRSFVSGASVFRVRPTSPHETDRESIRLTQIRRSQTDASSTPHEHGNASRAPAQPDTSRDRSPRMRPTSAHETDRENIRLTRARRSHANARGSRRSDGIRQAGAPRPARPSVSGEQEHPAPRAPRSQASRSDPRPDTTTPSPGATGGGRRGEVLSGAGVRGALVRIRRRRGRGG